MGVDSYYEFSNDQERREIGRYNKALIARFEDFIDELLGKVTREESSGEMRFDDVNPSLSVNRHSHMWVDHGHFNEKTGKEYGGFPFSLIMYHLGCDAETARKWVIDKGFIKGDTSGKRSDYIYTDADSKPAHKTVAIRYPDKRKKKLFWQEIWNEKHQGWMRVSGGVKKIQTYPYGLPALNAAHGRPVFFTEGERCADTVRSLGEVATTIAQGSKAWKKDYIEFFSGHKVYLLSDNDNTGQSFVERIAHDLTGIAAFVGILFLPWLDNEKDDVVDWKENGGTHELLLELANETKAYDDSGYRPIINLEDTLEEIATQSMDILKDKRVPIYQRNNELVIPKREDRIQDEEVVAYISFHSCDPHLLRSKLDAVAQFVQYDGRKKTLVPVKPPQDIVQSLMSPAREWSFPVLNRIIPAPTLRSDGSLFAKPGYDPITRAYLLPDNTLSGFDLPAYPTKDDGLAAIKFLQQLYVETPFADDESASTALAMNFTLAVRPLLDVVPMFVGRAPKARSGKTFISRIPSYIIFNMPYHATKAYRSIHQLDQSLEAAAMDGEQVILLDNLVGNINSSFLAQMLSDNFLSIRPYLQNRKNMKIECYCTIFATGTNVSFSGSIPERTLDYYIDHQNEHPERKQYKQRPVEMIQANRAKYLEACLLPVRHYIQEKMPASDKLTPFVGFEKWNQLVRGMMLYYGLADPYKTNNRLLTIDPEANLYRRFLAALVFDYERDVAFTCHELAKKLEVLEDQSELARIVAEITDKRSHTETINTKKLGNWLAGHVNDIVDGLQIVLIKKDTKYAHVWGVCGETQPAPDKWFTLEDGKANADYVKRNNRLESERESESNVVLYPKR